LSELKASLDAYLEQNLEFSELRTRWITALTNSPDLGKGALRLLYQQPTDRLLTEERVLSLKRIVETSIHEGEDDWTVAFDEDGDEKSLPAANQESVPAVQTERRTEPVNPPGKAQAAVTQRGPQSPVDAQQSYPAEFLSPGLVLCDRFVLKKPLGRGGIGIVYQARDRLRQSTIDGSDLIALKVLRGEFRTNSEWRDALQREALRAQRLSHPNIVRVYDFREDGETSFVTMELLEGESLRVLFARLRPDTIPRKRAMQIIAGMCRGLAYAHGRDVVHADFKPANVFLTKSDEPKILDFGFTGAVIPNVHQGSDHPAMRVLTPAYASSNRLEGGAPVIIDDVYSLSCVIYELMAGHHPYQKKSALEARELDLKPIRIDGLTDLQWHTLSAGLRPAPWASTTEVHDIQEAFAEQLPVQPVSGPVVIDPVVKEIVVRKLSFGWAFFATVFGILLGAVVVTGAVLLGFQPVPSKYMDIVRESAVMQAVQSTFGGRVEEPVAAGGTDSSELLPVESTDTDRKSIGTISNPQATDQTADAEALEPDSEAIAVPIPGLANQEFGGTLPTLDDDKEPAADSGSTIESVGDATASVFSGAPVYHLGQSAYSVHEGGVALTVQVHRTGDVSAVSSMEYSVVPDSADPQLDYAGLHRGLVEFAAGASTQDIFIPIVSDEIPESDERFLIHLGAPGEKTALGEPFTATVTIIDDD
jgi:serine/threonine protein kinase